MELSPLDIVNVQSIPQAKEFAGMTVQLLLKHGTRWFVFDADRLKVCPEKGWIDEKYLIPK